jgi:hypothetical protein
MKEFWDNIEGVKQLAVIGLLGVIICYASYNAEFKFLEGLVAGLFAALNISNTNKKSEEQK